jgi:hypothetical protein
MALYYQTDFGLGRRGRRIRRTYTGFWAFIAIIADLCFMLTLELTLAVLVLVLKATFRVILGLAYLLTLPFRAIRWVSARVRSSLGDSRTARGSFLVKPAWEGLAEI